MAILKPQTLTRKSFITSLFGTFAAAALPAYADIIPDANIPYLFRDDLLYRPYSNILGVQCEPVPGRELKRTIFDFICNTAPRFNFQYHFQEISKLGISLEVLTPNYIVVHCDVSSAPVDPQIIGRIDVNEDWLRDLCNQAGLLETFKQYA